MSNESRPDKGSKPFVPLSERQARIQDMIRQQAFAGVTELARQFNVAEQTIRKDLNRLCELGAARRVRGGIQPLNITGNTAYSFRQVLHHGAKQAIAQKVAGQIPNGISLAFSIGTTPEIVCRALLAHDRLRVFTNNVSLALIACSNPTFEVTIAGGRIRNEERDILGTGMEELFKAYKVDIGIYGAAGVDEDGTLLDFYDEEVRARQIIRQNCRQAYLVLDRSKFDRSAHVRGGRIDQADIIFCEAPPPLPICDMIQANGARLVTCDREAY